MNRTAMITGATAGLGRSLARQLAVAGFELVVHGRDTHKLETLAAEIQTIGRPVRTVRADITEPGEIAEMAGRVQRTADRLDVLVNNAAVGGGVDPTRREENSHGHELRLAGNYLAPYLLNRSLVPLLAATPGARIINVASIGQAPIDLSDLGFTRGYHGVEAYCRSKLALIMDTIDLAAELESSDVTVNSVHPAHLMETRMVRDSGLTPVTTADDGMLPVLRLALDSAVAPTTGRYFDRLDVAEPHAQSADAAVRAAVSAWAGDATVAVARDAVGR